MRPETSLLAELLSGNALPEQYLAVAVLSLMAVLGLWWHLDDAKRTARRRIVTKIDARRPCSTCFKKLPETHFRAPECPFCLECEEWFSRPKGRANRAGLRVVR